jgi:hypothetical protein
MTSSPISSARPRRLGALLAAVALLVGACSGSDDAGDDPSPASVTAVPGATSTTDVGSVDPDAAPLERYADYESISYDDPAHWVCRPDIEDDICDGDLDTTIVEADGTTTVERFEADPTAPIDCFYVYPTISQDQTSYSDWDFSPREEGYVTLQQAARLGSVCRVFAPVYRQRTLAALVAGIGGGDTALVGPEIDSFADVQDAFRTYMAQDNGGRGVVLIGHSQGTGMLNELIRTEVDPNEDVRELLVGAYLAGGTVAVPEGEVVGGDFEHVEVCTDPAQPGCVTSWASFASDAPPPEVTYFGRVREGAGVAACTNPAGAGDESIELSAYLPAERGQSILAPSDEPGPRTWLSDGTGEVDTPFVSLPGLVTGRCTSDERGTKYLEVTVTAAEGDRRLTDLGGRLTPEWGLHLLDVNLVMGDVVARVAEQAQAWPG